MKIVLTGGPSAGKTVIAETIVREFHDFTALVPEAASILFRGGFPRGITKTHLFHQQRSIYQLQVELEAMIGELHPGKILICDRGTIDGLAYWPSDDPRDYFASLGTSLEKEIKRYDYVVHLEAASAQYYDHSNPVRIENPQIAKAIDEKIKSVWSKHPRQHIIKNSVLFSEKAARVLSLVKCWIEKSR